jgi:hypothetical protein
LSLLLIRPFRDAQARSVRYAACLALRGSGLRASHWLPGDGATEAGALDVDVAYVIGGESFWRDLDEGRAVGGRS